ncbi:type II secretion system protein GspF, partial [Stenotrophomonas sp. 278]
MALFDYTALDDQGRSRSGSIAAATLDEASAKLARHQLVPVRLQP